MWVCSPRQKLASAGHQCHVAQHLLAAKKVGCNLRELGQITAILSQFFAEANLGKMPTDSLFLFAFISVLFGSMSLQAWPVAASFPDPHFLLQSFLSLTKANFWGNLRSRFGDRQAVRIFGPQPLTPIVRLSTASPGHVIHFAVQPEYRKANWHLSVFAEG